MCELLAGIVVVGIGLLYFYWYSIVTRNTRKDLRRISYSYKLRKKLERERKSHKRNGGTTERPPELH